MTDTVSLTTSNTTPSEFDSDTQITPLGGGRFTVDVPRSWSTGPGANGGFVAGLLARAALSDAQSGHD